MLRKIFSFLIIALVLLLAGAFIFIQTFDLNKFLPQLTSQISRSLGRDMTIQKAGLHLSFSQGIVADIEGISLAEDGRFSKGPFIGIDRIHCGVSLVALITKREIAVTSIVIESPQITIIRNEQGDSNYESLLKAAPASSVGSASSAGGDQGKPAAQAIPKILVNSFELRGGKIVVSDLAVKPPLHVTVDAIDAKVTNFSLSDTFKVQLDAAVFSPKKNIHLDGAGRIDMGLQQVRCDDVRLSFDLGLLDVARLNKDLPSVSALGLMPGLKGVADIVINQMVVSAKGLLVLSLEGKFSDGVVALKTMAKPIEELTVKFDVNESRVKVSEFSLKMGSGHISGNANIKNYMTAQDFDIQTSIADLLLEDVIDQKQSPAKLKGAVNGEIKLAGEGFAPQALGKVKGQAQIVLTNGELTNVNIIKNVFGRIPVLSALSEVAGAQLSQDLEAKIGDDLTKIEKATVKARIEDSTVLLDEALLTSQKFSLLAHGKAGFDQTVDMEAELRMTKEFSQSVIDSAGDMKALLDDNGEIHFPVKISGKVPDLNYMPDVAYIGKLIAINKGGGALQKVLDKNPEAKKFLDIFTGGGQETENAGQGSSSGDATGSEQAPKESSGEKLLKGLLKNL